MNWILISNHDIIIENIFFGGEYDERIEDKF